jgi:hypothetical protein
MDKPWTTELYEAESGASPITKWLDKLGPVQFAAINAAITHVLEPHGIDLVRTEWLKALGGGLHEFRVRHTAKEIVAMFAGADLPVPAEAHGRVLLRVFVHFHGARVILLVNGYDKGRDPSTKRQHREIAGARRLLRAWRADQARR